MFPLYVHPSGVHMEDELSGDRRPNLSEEYVDAFRLAVGLRFVPDGSGDLDETFGPADIFHYLYAVLHSPEYRQRYAEFLKYDYPRVPLPGSRAMFTELVHPGARLSRLHLMAVSRDDLSAPATFPVDGSNVVERVRYATGRSETTGRVWINGTQYFDNVPPDIYQLMVGGYTPAEKWLKDRKGRRLSSQDIEHYCTMVAALGETGHRMTEIDSIINEYGGWPVAFESAEPEAPQIVPFRPASVEPDTADRYVTCVPLFDLKAAAGGFGDPQHIDQADDLKWVRVDSRHRLRPGMFVAQIVGRSMEPAIPDNSWCLFRSPVEGTRQGKTVLVELRGDPDPDTGERYTVKRYTSEKAERDDDGDWRHTRITLNPINPDYSSIVLSAEQDDAFRVVAEFLEVVMSQQESEDG